MMRRGCARRLTGTAIDVGYRNFFASVLARNQRGFAQAVKESSVPRSELYICGTMLSNSARGYADACHTPATLFLPSASPPQSTANERGRSEENTFGSREEGDGS